VGDSGVSRWPHTPEQAAAYLAYRIRWAKEKRAKTPKTKIPKKSKEQLREMERARRARYNERHKEAIRLKRKTPEFRRVSRGITMRYQANKKQRLHKDHSVIAETELHSQAIRLTKETGIKHHVDHIIPIWGGGWHHHANLQVLPALINASKGRNPFWEQAPYKSWRDVPEELWPDNLADEYNALKYGIAI
jgi:hypothetical protein